jgi:hypothetical protein
VSDDRLTRGRLIAAHIRRQFLPGVAIALLVVGFGLFAWHVQKAQFRERDLQKIGLSTKMCDAAADFFRRRTGGRPPSAEDPVQVYLLSYLDRCKVP